MTKSKIGLLEAECKRVIAIGNISPGGLLPDGSGSNLLWLLFQSWKQSEHRHTGKTEVYACLAFPANIGNRKRNLKESLIDMLGILKELDIWLD